MVTHNLKSKFRFKFGVCVDQIKNCKITNKLITDYLKVIRKSIQGSIPRTIVHLLVNAIGDQVGSELLKRVYKPAGNYDELLQRINSTLKLELFDHQKTEVSKRHQKLEEISPESGIAQRRQIFVLRNGDGCGETRGTSTTFSPKQHSN